MLNRINKSLYDVQVLTNDTEEGSSPTEQEAASAALLRKRTGALERENRALREEATRLAAGADSAELAERQLLRDIAHQLGKTYLHYDTQYPNQ